MGINTKHKWRVKEEASNMYDTSYQCLRCKAYHTVSIDNTKSELPETGCYKSQSKLQTVNSFTNWVNYFFLRKFPGNFIHRLGLTSSETVQLIAQYNLIVRKLQDSIKDDYKEYKRMILEMREEKKEREDA